MPSSFSTAPPIIQPPASGSDEPSFSAQGIPNIPYDAGGISGTGTVESPIAPKTPVTAGWYLLLFSIACIALSGQPKVNKWIAGIAGIAVIYQTGAWLGTALPKIGQNAGTTAANNPTAAQLQQQGLGVPAQVQPLGSQAGEVVGGLQPINISGVGALQQIIGTTAG